MVRILILFSIVSGITAKGILAQTPGYMGKKYGAGYQFGFFVSPQAIYNSDAYSTGTLIPMKHTLFIDITAGRKVNFDLSWSLYFSKCRFFQESEISMNSNITSPFTFSPAQNENLVKMHVVEASMCLFTSRFIAPLGTFHILKAGGIFGELSGGNQMEGSTPMEVGPNTVWVPATIYGKNLYAAARLGYGIGQRRMLGPSIYIKYSAAVHAFIGEFFAWEPGGYGQTRDYIGKYIGQHSRVGNRYELNLGLGYLIF